MRTEVSEHVTAQECSDVATAGTDVERALMLHRAAATIEALQERPPSSADTDASRWFARDTIESYQTDDPRRALALEMGMVISVICDALDAARAELLAMSRFQCPQPDVAVCEKRWQADHQLACLQHVDETCGTALAEEFGIWGCDIIEHVADALDAARAELAARPKNTVKPDDLPGSPCYERLRAECKRLRQAGDALFWAGSSDDPEAWPIACELWLRAALKDTQ